MTYTMTDDRRKLLTEKVLGECWHDFGAPRDENLIPMCGKCNQSKMFPWVKHRLFNTWQDLGDVFKKLVDDGKFNDFSDWVYVEYIITKKIMYMAWLFYSPERFCWLVSKWLKEGK